MTQFREDEDYRAVFTINDESGSPVPLAGAEIKYVLTRKLGGGEIILTKTTDDARVTVEPNDQTGVVKVRLEADEVNFVGVVFEELRVRRSSFSEVPIQRSVRFAPTATDP